MGLFDDLNPNPAPAADASGGSGLFGDLPPAGTGMFSDAHTAGEPDPQRSRTVLERVFDALGTTNYASAGAARALLTGDNPLEGAAEGIKSHTTYGDLLREHGVTNPWVAVPAGLALDVALDPLTYTGIGGLTKAGEAAKGASLAAKLAETAPAAEKATQAAEAAARIANAGELGSNLAEQAAKGQWAGVTLGGRSVLPAPVNQALGTVLDRIGGAAAQTEPVKAARRMFMIAPELTGLDREAFMARRSQATAAKNIALREGADALRPHASAVGEAADAAGVPARDWMRALSDAQEGAVTDAANAADTLPDAIGRSVETALSRFTPEQQAALRQPFTDAVGALSSLYSHNLGKTQDAGIKIGKLSDTSLNYAFHVVRPEAAEALSKAGLTPEEWLPRLTEQHASQMRRGLRGMPLTGINDLAEAGQLVIGGQKLPPIPGGIYEENPFVAGLMRAGAAGKAIGNADLIRGYAEQYGRQMPAAAARGVPAPALDALRNSVSNALRAGNPQQIKAAQQALADAKRGATLARKALSQQQRDLAQKWTAEGYAPLTTTIRGMENVWLPKEVVHSIEAHGQAMQRPGVFAQALGRVNSIWKRYALLSPEFHLRNEAGDLWNASILGGMNPTRIADSMAALWRGGDARTFTLAGKQYTGAELKALAERNNVIGAGVAADAADALDTVRHATGGALSKVNQVLGDNVLTRLNFAAGEVRENSTRLAFFMDRLAKGDTPEVAALAVKKHLFDYGELTPFEQQKLKLVMPFYSWTRFNSPLQLAAMGEHPGAFAGIQHLRDESAQGQGLGIGDTPMPRFLAENVPLRLGNTSEGNPQFWRLGGWIPGTDVQNVIDPGQALQNAAGMLSPALKAPLESGLNVSLFRSDLGSGAFQPMEQYPGELTSLLGMPVNKRWIGAPLSNFRPLAELNRMNPGGIFGTDTEPAYNGMGTVRDHPDVDPAMRLLNAIMGRVYAVDPAQEAMRAQKGDARELAGLQGDLRRAMSRGDEANARQIEKRILALTGGGQLAAQ